MSLEDGRSFVYNDRDEFQNIGPVSWEQEHNKLDIEEGVSSFSTQPKAEEPEAEEPKESAKDSHFEGEHTCGHSTKSGRDAYVSC